MSDNYKLFFGVVEDIFDPEKLGRVRVRIHEVHSPYNDILNTQDLPWSNVFIPASLSASISGIGHSNISLLQGSLVAGTFVDGNDRNEFAVLWSIGGIPEKHSGSPKGNPMFKDPDGVFPLEYGIKDFNKLAIADDIQGTPIFNRNKNIVSEIYTAKETTWKEPSSRYAAKYPWNNVQQTVSNHLFEFDDTPDKERINIQHKSLSYLTFHSDGSIAIKDYKARYDLSKKRLNYTDGDFYSSVTSHRYDSIKNNWKIVAKNMQLSGNMKIFGDLDVTKKITADSAHFNTIEAKYAKTLAEVAVCAKSICPFGTTSASGVDLSVDGKIIIDTISEAYELADLGISNAKIANDNAIAAQTSANTAQLSADGAQTSANDAKSAADLAQESANNANELADVALEQSNKTTEYRGTMHLGAEPLSPSNRDIWIDNDNNTHQYNSNQWIDSNMRFKFKVNDLSQLPNTTNFIIQSGLVPDPLDEAQNNIWLNPLTLEFNQWVLTDWESISNNVIEVLTSANIVEDIYGSTPQEIVEGITENNAMHLNTLNAISISKGVLDGSITLFNDLSEPEFANLGDVWINNSEIFEYVEIGSGLFEWTKSNNSDNIFSLIKAHIDLNEFKSTDVTWFFQDVEPSNMKVGDLWYNDITFEVKRYTADDIWIENITSASDIKGSLSNVDLSISSENKGSLNLNQDSFKLDGLIEGSLENIVSMYYDLLDESVDHIMSVGSTFLEKDGLVLSADSKYKALTIYGNMDVDGVSTFNNVNINDVNSNNISISNNLSVSGLASISQCNINTLAATDSEITNLTVKGNSILKNANINDLIVSTLSVSDNSSMKNLSLDNISISDNLTSNGSAMLNGVNVVTLSATNSTLTDCTISNNLSVAGHTYLNTLGVTSITTNEISSNNITTSNNLEVLGHTSLNTAEMSSLNLNNLSSTNITTSNNLSVNGDTTLKSVSAESLIVTNDITTSNNLSVNGNTTLKSVSAESLIVTNEITTSTNINASGLKLTNMNASDLPVATTDNIGQMKLVENILLVSTGTEWKKL